METGTVEIEDSANAIAYNATTKKVFIADTISGIKAIDVTDPEDPFEIANYEEADRSLKIAASGDLCFVGDFLEGIRVIDFSDIYGIDSHLITDSILPNTLKVKNGYLYVGDLKDGFKSYRIEPNTPWLVKEDTCVDTTGIMTAVIAPDV